MKFTLSDYAGPWDYTSTSPNASQIMVYAKGRPLKRLTAVRLVSPKLAYVRMPILMDFGLGCQAVFQGDELAEVTLRIDGGPVVVEHTNGS